MNDANDHPSLRLEVHVDPRVIVSVDHDGMTLVGGCQGPGCPDPDKVAAMLEQVAATMRAHPAGDTPADPGGC